MQPAGLTILLSAPAKVGTALARVGRRLRRSLRRRQAVARQTYWLGNEPPQLQLGCYFREVPDACWPVRKLQSAALADLAIAHRFDLLGSGWVRVRHGMPCRGVEGYRYPPGAAVTSDDAGRWLEGRINAANLPEAQRVWRLVDAGYTPIDWQLDFKSGYRWAEATWHAGIRFGHLPGVDVKVPWELARTQHLPQLAWAYAGTRASGTPGAVSAPGSVMTEAGVAVGISGTTAGPVAPSDKDVSDAVTHAPDEADTYLREFRNQILDFIATNPPGFGVNWSCPMDVAIRMVNWLVTLDLFRAAGAAFDQEFLEVLGASVHSHGAHLIENLEWSPLLKSNHYLADIVGLVFAGAYLPRSPQTDAWLAFGVQELVREAHHQFTPDGANFEASTCYHRLAAEMVVYATALALAMPPERQAALRTYDHRLVRAGPGLDPAPLRFHTLPVRENPPPHAPQPPRSDSDQFGQSPFPPSYWERLERAAEFTVHASRPDGHILDIGDHDSGRLLKLFPVFHQLTVAEARARYAHLDGYDSLPGDTVYLEEDHLDHRHLVAAINGFFLRPDLAQFAGPAAAETALISRLAGDRRVTGYRETGAKGAEAVRVDVGPASGEWQGWWGRRSLEQERTVRIALPGGDLLSGMRCLCYPDFGLYVFRGPRFLLTVRCGAMGQDGNGGHAHNDQLAMTLWVDGEDWVVDPGSYLYTPLPHRRNAYRSVAAHFAPQATDGSEPCRLDAGLFSLPDSVHARCLQFTDATFVGTHRGFRNQVFRLIRVEPGCVTVSDWCGDPRLLAGAGTASTLTAPVAPPLPISPGYGLQRR